MLCSQGKKDRNEIREEGVQSKASSNPANGPGSPGSNEPDLSPTHYLGRYILE